MRRGLHLGAAAVLVFALAGLAAGGAPGHFAPRASASVSPVEKAPAVTDSERSAGPAPGLAGPGLVPFAGFQEEMVVNTTDPSAVPNTGIRVNLTGYASSGPLGPEASIQLSVRAQIGDDTAVFGLFQNNQLPPTAFFSVFPNGSIRASVSRLWSNFPIVPGTSYDFELVSLGTGVWELRVNGLLFEGNASAADVEFNASLSSSLAGLAFQEVAFFQTTSSVPSAVSVPLAFAVLRPSGWYLPTNARAFALTNGGPPAELGGIEGRIQHPTLAPGQIEAGTSVPSSLFTNGSELWTGGPVPVNVSVTADPPSTVGLTPILANASVSGAGGAPLPGVPVYFHDLYDASFTPPTATTNGTGTVSSIFLTPNVTAASTDTLSAVVTLFGYVGGASASVELTPPVRVFVSASPANPTVAPSHSLLLQFVTSNGAGAPVAAVLLAFGLTGPGVLSSTAAISDANGQAAVTYVAPSAATSFGLRVEVVSAGEWGFTEVLIRVAAPPGGFWNLYGAYGVEVGIAAVLAVAAFVVLRRIRRRRRALPSLPLRAYRKADAAVPSVFAPRPSGPETPAADDPSRTPPG